MGESKGSASTATRLLEAASEVAGGDRALAGLLGLTETRLSTYRTGVRPLPDHLLLRAVDVLLEAREHPATPGHPMELPHPKSKPFPG